MVSKIAVLLGECTEKQHQIYSKAQSRLLKQLTIQFAKNWITNEDKTVISFTRYSMCHRYLQNVINEAEKAFLDLCTAFKL